MSMFLPKKISKQDPEILKILNKTVERILATGLADRIYVFGSWARGTFTEASDLDFAVLVNKQSDVKLFYEKFSRRGLDWPIDVLALEKESFQQKSQLGGVCMLIADEGEVLYESPI